MSIPRRRLTNGLTSNTSNPSMSSPVPMNITGLFVAATLHIQGQIEIIVRDENNGNKVQISKISKEKSKQIPFFSVWSHSHKL